VPRTQKGKVEGRVEPFVSHIDALHRRRGARAVRGAERKAPPASPLRHSHPPVIGGYSCAASVYKHCLHSAIVPAYLTFCSDFTEVTSAGEAGAMAQRLGPAGPEPLTERAMRELMLLS
jgi:hypothetical protein